MVELLYNAIRPLLPRRAYLAEYVQRFPIVTIVNARVDLPRLPDPINPIPPELSSMLCDSVLY